MTTKAHRYFVVGATGNQGGSVARTLLSRGLEVSCLVRSVSASAAVALQAEGARLVQGDFEDTAALTQAAEGCDGLFLVTSPGSGDESQQARNVLTAARDAGVKVVVASTSTRAEEHETFPRWNPEGLMAGYWRGKTEVQRLVQETGFRSWTILQPAWLMTNFITPVSQFYWPELATEGVLLSACDPDTKLQLTDSEDVGHCAAIALADCVEGRHSDRWSGRIIRLASEELTMGEAAKVITDVIGRTITAKFRSKDEIEELVEKNPLVWSQVWQSESGTKVDMQMAKQYGQETSLRSFLERNREAALAAVATAK